MPRASHFPEITHTLSRTLCPHSPLHPPPHTTRPVHAGSWTPPSSAHFRSCSRPGSHPVPLLSGFGQLTTEQREREGSAWWHKEAGLLDFATQRTAGRYGMGALGLLVPLPRTVGPVWVGWDGRPPTPAVQVSCWVATACRRTCRQGLSGCTFLWLGWGASKSAGGTKSVLACDSGRLAARAGGEETCSTPSPPAPSLALGLAAGVRSAGRGVRVFPSLLDIGATSSVSMTWYPVFPQHPGGLGMGSL